MTPKNGQNGGWDHQKTAFFDDCVTSARRHATGRREGGNRAKGGGLAIAPGPGAKRSGAWSDCREAVLGRQQARVRRRMFLHAATITPKRWVDVIEMRVLEAK